MNIQLPNTVSTKIIPRKLHAERIYGKVVFPKPLVPPQNAMKQRLQKRITTEWERVICVISDLSITFFQTTRRVSFWQTAAKSFNVDCLVSTVRHTGGSVLV
ncbi:hypothetical protein NPIL_662681 [Nephila pilipes]|uniref:Uncharacterized protein n=1 Tax=Nephila pilipes TaxID=299642 RepID=A0A8X6MLV9_NEPPI|nr:hypothetical protein NPIL_662681 [Nephila pilipes]